MHRFSLRNLRFYEEPGQPSNAGTPPADPPAPGAPPADPAAPDPKEHDRLGFQLRELEKKLKTLETENQGYKDKAEEERKSKLTEEQRVKEEVDTLKREKATLEHEKLKAKVGKEFKLPDEFIERLQGADEDALRADAEKLAPFVPKTKVGGPNDPPQEPGSPKTYKTSQLKDHSFFLANQADIMKAYKEGRIVEG